MTWRDRVRQASWRGVHFDVVSATFTLGRHVVVHEFPLRDEPFAEDLARKARQISVEGRITDPDFDLEIDNFREAIEWEGEGTLVLPTFGRVVMQLTEGTINLPFEQGSFSFTLQLTEAGSRSFPEVEAQPATSIENSADAVRDGSNDSFTKRFAFSGFQSWVSDGVLTDVLDALQLVDAARINDTWTEAEEKAIDDAALDLFLDIFNGTFTPESVADGSQEYLVLLDRWETYRLAMDAFDTNPSGVSIGSTSWDQDNANELAITRLYRRTCLASLSEAAIDDLEFDSRDEALEIQSYVIGLFDRELTETDVNEDPETFVALSQARLAFLDWIESVALDLVPLKTYTPSGPVPALVIAQRLYGDADRAQEIIDRNAVEHPLFVRGGQPLRVLAE
jgi:prophage DNA circulation protein